MAAAAPYDGKICCIGAGIPPCRQFLFLADILDVHSQNGRKSCRLEADPKIPIEPSSLSVDTKRFNRRPLLTAPDESALACRPAGSSGCDLPVGQISNIPACLLVAILRARATGRRVCWRAHHGHDRAQDGAHCHRCRPQPAGAPVASLR